MDDHRHVRILGIAGSLRSGSYNRALLRAAVRTAPHDAILETADLAGIPLYDADLQADGDPDAVRRLKAAVHAADGLLIVTPEYNNSIPGVLKNAIDWVSRPPSESPLEGKPVAIMGATDGPWGTVRAQQQLRLVLASVGAVALSRPIVFVPRVSTLLDDTGEIADEDTLRRVAGLTRALVAFARALSQAREAESARP